ncbi:hypothetical protein niasHT_008420 [Heterodera trifolii]|uniref:Uncharacterized protein n=1 Tax=Heterodera trifolii TaxID=157864 RepID=A0ABD2M2A2_9BILA
MAKLILLALAFLSMFGIVCSLEEPSVCCDQCGKDFLECQSTCKPEDRTGNVECPEYCNFGLEDCSRDKCRKPCPRPKEKH